MPAPDARRYRLEGPPAGADEAAWRAALDNARAQLEHQALRIQNLELLTRHGAKSWGAHVAGLGAACVAAEAELARLSAAVTDVNKTRKVQQTAAGMELRKMEAQWWAGVRACGEIDAALHAVEAAAAVASAAAAAAAPAAGAGDAEMAT